MRNAPKSDTAPTRMSASARRAPSSAPAHPSHPRAHLTTARTFATAARVRAENAPPPDGAPPSDMGERHVSRPMTLLRSRAVSALLAQLNTDGITGAMCVCACVIGG
jgi:hypothetical protein